MLEGFSQHKRVINEAYSVKRTLTDEQSKYNTSTRGVFIIQDIHVKVIIAGIFFIVTICIIIGILICLYLSYYRQLNLKILAQKAQTARAWKSMHESALWMQKRLAQQDKTTLTVNPFYEADYSHLDPNSRVGEDNYEMGSSLISPCYASYGTFMHDKIKNGSGSDGNVDHNNVESGIYTMLKKPAKQVQLMKESVDQPKYSQRFLGISSMGTHGPPVPGKTFRSCSSYIPPAKVESSALPAINEAATA